MTTLDLLKEQCAKVVGLSEPTTVWDNQAWLACYELRQIAARLMSEMALGRMAEHHKLNPPKSKVTKLIPPSAWDAIAALNPTAEELEAAIKAVTGGQK